MMEGKIITRMFDAMDEADLALVIQQSARRLLTLRAEVPDTAFWFDTLQRITKMLNAVPTVNEKEKQLILHPAPGTNGRIRAVRNLRERTGMRLKAACEIVETWMKKHNLDVIKNA
jgi:hypothetical protein